MQTNNTNKNLNSLQFDEKDKRNALKEGAIKTNREKKEVNMTKKKHTQTNSSHSSTQFIFKSEQNERRKIIDGYAHIARITLKNVKIAKAQVDVKELRFTTLKPECHKYEALSNCNTRANKLTHQSKRISGGIFSFTIYFSPL